MKAVGLRLPEELLARLDQARGEIPRERWIRGAIEQRLGPPSEETVTVAIDNFTARRIVRASSEHKPTCTCAVCKPPKGA